MQLVDRPGLGEQRKHGEGCDHKNGGWPSGQQRFKGIFHSVNYSYIYQNEKEIFFIGSLNDNKAFTFIEFNCPENYIEIKRDFEGKIISSKEDIFHLYLAKWNKKELLDKYFNLNSYVEKPKKIMRGWTSWYNYYEDISEEIIIKNCNCRGKVCFHL